MSQTKLEWRWPDQPHKSCWSSEKTPIDQTEFILETSFDNLPNWFRVEYLSNYLRVSNMNCQGEYCRNQNDCWCDFSTDVEEKGEAATAFYLEGTYKDYWMNVKGVKVDDENCQFSLTFEEVKQDKKIVNTVTKSSISIFKFAYPTENGKVQEVALGSKDTVYHAKFEYDFHLDHLPGYFQISYYQSSYRIDDLNCTGDECQKNEDDLCWCKMINHLDSAQDGTVWNQVFVLQNVLQNGYQSKYKTDIVVVKKDKDNVSMQLEFDILTNSSISDQNILKFDETVDNQEHEVTMIRLNREIDRTVFHFDAIIPNLPKKLLFRLYGTTNYATKEVLRCENSECPKDHPCWCRLIEQFKGNNNNAQMRIPLFSEYKHQTYWAIVFAERDQKNKDLIHLFIKLKYSYGGSYYTYGTRVNNDAVWIPEGQENNPYKKFLFFDPEEE